MNSTLQRLHMVRCCWHSTLINSLAMMQTKDKSDMYSICMWLSGSHVWKMDYLLCPGSHMHLFTQVGRKVDVSLKACLFLLY